MIKASCAVALFLIAFFCSRAQDVKQRVPIISLGRIALPEVKNGKMIPTNTTRQEILKNALLIADVNNCHVTGYKFSMIAPGVSYYGPVYISSAELTDSLKNKIKQQNGPNVKIFIEDIKVEYRGREMGVNALAFKYDE